MRLDFQEVAEAIAHSFTAGGLLQSGDDAEGDESATAAEVSEATASGNPKAPPGSGPGKARQRPGGATSKSG